MTRWTTCAAIAEARCIGILRASSAAAAVSAGRALVQGGVTVVEVAFTTPGAPAANARSWKPRIRQPFSSTRLSGIRGTVPDA